MQGRRAIVAETREHGAEAVAVSANVGKPEDVAKAAVWLASGESDYIVGTTLFVDGGMLPAFRERG